MAKQRRPKSGTVTHIKLHPEIRDLILEQAGGDMGRVESKAVDANGFTIDVIVHNDNQWQKRR